MRKQSQLDGLNRRDFGKLVATLCALGCVEPHAMARALGPSPQRLSWRAFRNAETEGSWHLNKIEGEIPKDLFGTLVRIAPGQSDNHGTILQHFFDGDPFVSAFSFADGKATLTSQFLATKTRVEELAAKRMLYREFGTSPPPAMPDPDAAGEGQSVQPVGGKNQPNVNIVHYDNRLLALSEGGHPTAVDPKTLAVQGEWDFHGTLPAYIPFTAHPKFDPDTGEGYGFGVTQGPGMALNVFRLGKDGKLTKLHSVPQAGYFMIHDMLLTKRHLVFVIPPVQFDMATLFKGESSPADAIRYLEQEPTRILVLRRDGTGSPIVAKQPANMVFHNGNAFERDGKIVVDTVLSRNDDVLRLLWSSSKDTLPIPEFPPELTRLVIDPVIGEVVSRTALEGDQEFPRFDTALAGTDAKYLFTVEGGIAEDPLASTRLVRHNLHAGTSRRIDAGKGRAYGEAVPVNSSASNSPSWLMQQGYDTDSDQTFLEIRDHDTLDLAARVWTGFHFPLGFHGNFVPSMQMPSPAAV